MNSLSPGVVHSLPFLETRAQVKVVHGPLQLLSECRQGESVEVVQLRGSDKLQGRLEAVGVFPGQQLRIFRAGRWSGLVVDGEDMRLALDQRLAHLILVKKTSPQA